MSVAATKLAWLQAINRTDKLVLLALAWRADAKAQARVSIAGLADDTGLDERTVRRSLARLNGHSIEFKAERYVVTTYRLIGLRSAGTVPTDTTTTVVPAGRESTGREWIRRLEAKAFERGQRVGYKQGHADAQRKIEGAD